MLMTSVLFQNYQMMSPVIGETALSGFPTYAVPPVGCHTATLNGSASALNRTVGTVAVASMAGSGVTGTECGYVPQTGAAVGKALASVRTHKLYTLALSQTVVMSDSVCSRRVKEELTLLLFHECDAVTLRL